MITLRIAGLDELLKIAGADLRPTIRAILHGIGELIRDQMQPSPGPVHKPIIWASQKQRRYVMMLVRKFGPWVRETHSLSQRMQGGWTVKDLDDYHVKVGTHATYGPWVQNAEMQTAQHRATGWMTDDRAIANVAASGDLERVAAGAINRFLEGHP